MLNSRNRVNSNQHRLLLLTPLKKSPNFVRLCVRRNFINFAKQCDTFLIIWAFFFFFIQQMSYIYHTYLNKKINIVFCPSNWHVYLHTVDLHMIKVTSVSVLWMFLSGRFWQRSAHLWTRRPSAVWMKWPPSCASWRSSNTVSSRDPNFQNRVFLAVKINQFVLFRTLFLISLVGQFKGALKSAATSAQQQLHTHAAASVDGGDIQRWVEGKICIYFRQYVDK